MENSFECRAVVMLKSKNELSGKCRFLMLTGDILAQITCAESAECVYSVNIEVRLLLTM